MKVIFTMVLALMLLMVSCGKDKKDPPSHFIKLLSGSSSDSSRLERDPADKAPAGSNRYPIRPLYNPKLFTAIAECYAKGYSSQKSGREKYQLAFQGLPQEQFYKMFIDKERLQNPETNELGYPPHLLFDVKEPGYYKSMIMAFDTMSHSIDKTAINVSLIIDIRNIAVQGVGKIQQWPVPSGSYYYYGLLSDKIDPHALKELMMDGVLYVSYLDPDKLKDRNNYLSYLTMRNGDYYVNSSFSAGNRIDIIKEKLRSYFLRYEKEIKKAKNIDEKLFAIADLLRTLEIYHFLPDGNQRTYAFLMLNKLLIENNLLPAILDSPFIFDGYRTVKDTAAFIKLGIDNFIKETEAYQLQYIKDNCSL